MNDTEKKLSADIKVYDLKGKFLRKEVRNNFPKIKNRYGNPKLEKDRGGWN